MAETNGEWWAFVGAMAGAIVTGVVTVVIWILSRKRPRKIRVLEVATISLLRVADAIRPRIATSFDGSPVDALSQIEYLITNNGPDTIHDIELQIRFPEATSILYCEMSGMPAEQKKVDANQLMISIPFLNAYRHYHESVTAKIVCDGRMEGVAVEGRGEGWSSEQATLNTIEKSHFRIAAVSSSILVVGLGIITVVTTVWLRSALNVAAGDFSLPVFFVQVPLLLCLLLVPVLSLSWLRRGIKRTRGQSP